MRRILIPICFLLAGRVFGQIPTSEADTTQFYMATYQVSLSGSGAAFTLQVPAKATKRVYLRSVILECSTDCTVSQDKNGTAAAGTAVTAVPLNTDGTPTAVFYRNSDAGTGSQLLPITVTAGTQYPIDASYTVFARGAAAAQNMNWRVSAITGTARVSLVWGER